MACYVIFTNHHCFYLGVHRIVNLSSVDFHFELLLGGGGGGGVMHIVFYLSW